MNTAQQLDQQNRQYLLNVYRAKCQQLRGLTAEIKLMQQMLGLKAELERVRETDAAVEAIDEAGW